MIHSFNYHIANTRKYYTRDEGETLDTWMERTLALAQDALAHEQRNEKKLRAKEAHEEANRAVSKQAGGNYRLQQRKDRYR